MSPGHTDLDAYLSRIGWSGPVAPDRATLSALVYHHTLAIPFENIDPLLGHVPDLAPEALMAKLVHGRRGGYCYEQNGLLRIILERIGFSVLQLSARVLWGQEDDTVITRRTHMLLGVELPDGLVLVDAGFGVAVPTGVLDLVPDRVQETPHEPFRLTRFEDGDWKLQVEMGGHWRSIYRFDLTRHHPIDYTLANWFTATSPDSHFTQGLTCARVLPGRRLTLHNLDLTDYPVGGEGEHRSLTPEQACDALERDFGIALPDRAALTARLAAIAAGASA